MKRSDIIRILKYTLGVVENGGKRAAIKGSLQPIINRLQGTPTMDTQDVFDFFNKNIYPGK